MTETRHVVWLREAPDHLDDVIARLEAETTRIRADHRLSPQGRHEALVELRESVKGELAEIVEEARKAESVAQWHVTQVLRPPTDPTERLLRESEEQRAWHRARALLEAGTDPSEVIARAGEAGDIATLRALRAELPTWLETTAASAIDDLRRPGARQQARHNVEPLLEDIDRAEAPHLPAKQRNALQTKFQTQALGKVLRAKQVLVDDLLSGRDAGGSYIRAGLATAEAERGLVGSTPAGA